MTNPLAQDLGGVVRMLEKATPGVLTCSDGPHGYQHRISVGHLGVCDVFASSDAAAIAACVNFLRTHSAEIAGALRDAERYRWLREHVTDRFVRNNEHEPCLLLPHNVDYLSPDEIDAAIDSAMQQGG